MLSAGINKLGGVTDSAGPNTRNLAAGPAAPASTPAVSASQLGISKPNSGGWPWASGAHCLAGAEDSGSVLMGGVNKIDVGLSRLT